MQCRRPPWQSNEHEQGTPDTAARPPYGEPFPTGIMHGHDCAVFLIASPNRAWNGNRYCCRRMIVRHTKQGCRPKISLRCAAMLQPLSTKGCGEIRAGFHSAWTYNRIDVSHGKKALFGHAALRQSYIANLMLHETCHSQGWTASRWPLDVMLSHLESAFRLQSCQRERWLSSDLFCMA